MVLEEFLKNYIYKKKFLLIFLGAICVIVCSAIVFLIRKYLNLGDDISVFLLFAVTMVLTPTLAKVIGIEEKVERKEGINHFFRNHRQIFELYLFLLIGVFIGFLTTGFFLAEMPQKEGFNEMFSYQLNFFDKSSIQEVTAGSEMQQKTESMIRSYSPSPERVAGITFNNLAVFLISFALSFFYGAGAIFLVVMNASIFATFLNFVLIFISKSISQALIIIGTFLMHLTPELAGFLFAAIAGGILSKAVLRERFFSAGFRNVLKDSLLILGFSILLIIIGAFVEVYVSPVLLNRLLFG